MDVATWTDSRIDSIRARRLGVGFVMGAAILGGAVAFVASASTGHAQAEEEPLDVVFGELPPEEEIEPEAEPEPEPPPPDAGASISSVGPPRVGPKPVPIDVAPDSVPTTEASETTPPPGGIKPGSDPNQEPGGGGTAREGSTSVVPPPKAPPVPEPPPPPKPRPKKRKKPARITEGMTPPQRVGGGAPGYPAAAKSQGIEGTVVVTYVVTEAGAVTNVQAVRGPALLQGVCVAAVQGWRFKPAMDANGNPIAARRIAKFPFHIRTD